MLEAQGGSLEEIIRRWIRLSEPAQSSESTIVTGTKRQRGRFLSPLTSPYK